VQLLDLDVGAASPARSSPLSIACGACEGSARDAERAREEAGRARRERDEAISQVSSLLEMVEKKTSSGSGDVAADELNTALKVMSTIPRHPDC